jgi:tRNA1(Val) A37 N6-methylase TrmN6
MDYEDACEATVTREEARREIARHNIDGTFEDFLAEVGDRAEYSGDEVLGWLGY